MRPPSILAAAALAVLVSLLVGCGGGSADNAAVTIPPNDLERVGVVLDGHVGPANVALRIAERRGLFEEAGFEAEVADPVIPANTILYVADGINDFGISQEPQVVIGKAKGAPIVAVASLVPRPTAALIWLRDSELRRVVDLRGKTIAVTGIPYQKELLRAALARAGLTFDDVKLRLVHYSLMNALRTHKADAIFGASSNIEGAMLKAQGLDPVVRPVQGLGIPSYEELVVITREDRLRENPESVRDFLATLDRGFEVAEGSPEATVRWILKDTERNHTAGAKATRASLEATLPLLSHDYRMNLRRARKLIDWMYARGMIDEKPAADELFTNEYLPQP